MSFIRALLYYFITFTAMLIVGFPFVLVYGGILGHWNDCTKICTKFFIVMFKLFGIKVTVKGKENVPQGGGYVIVSNHQSFLDINMIWPYINSSAFIAKKDLWKVPLFGKMLTNIGCIPVDRKDPRKNAGMGKIVQERLSKGYTITVFPEGHRSEADGRMMKFQNGIFRMAKEHHFDILPITLIGTGARLAKKRFSLMPGDVHIIIHPLIKPEDYAEKPMNEFRDEVHDLIESVMPYKQEA